MKAMLLKSGKKSDRRTQIPRDERFAREMKVGDARDETTVMRRDEL